MCGKKTAVAIIVVTLFVAFSSCVAGSSLEDNVIRALLGAMK